MKMFRKDEGFTLVELMVVVLIIGILVAIAIPVFNAARATAQERSCQGNQRIIEGAVEQWVAANLGGAVTDLDGAVDAAHALCDDTAGNEYIKEVPLCPTNGTGYTLASGSTACPDAGHAHYTTVNQ